MESPHTPVQALDVQSPPESDHVNLRITYLVAGNPRTPHFLRNIHLSTTVLELKTRLQSDLPEHPSPDVQRLIYQGRPLLQNNITLRDILRVEPGRESPTPYTIHIIIQLPQTSTQPQPPPNPVANHPPPPVPAPPHLPQIDFTNHDASTARIQEHIGRIQQQLEANRADLRSVQQRIALQTNTLVNNPLAGHMAAHHQAIRNTPPPGIGLNVQNGHPFHPQQQIPGQIPPHLGQIPLPPPLPQRASNAGTPVPQLGPQNPVPQNPPRMTIMTSTLNLHHPAQRPASAPGQRPLTSHQPTGLPTGPPTSMPQPNMPTAAPVIPRPGVNWTAMPPLANVHMPGPFSRPNFNPMQPATTTAWLLSSPSGPQGFLFAPGHGYFSSISPVTPQQQEHGGSANQQPLAGDGNQAAAPQPDHVPNNAQDADRAIVPADQAQPAAGLAQAQQNVQDNDLFAFFISRGWLFLRLYLFMFVFSEPGTWKRWLMIIAAAVICLQPRNGPFTRMMTAARRHFDNLVGPPAPQPRLEAGAQQVNPAGQPRPAGPQNEVQTQRPANVRGAVQMTPEEAAARIIRERRDQQDRPPRFWRDAFYRVEQSIALFLASLVPGVGERHVQAREEARREEQRREEERQRAAEEAATAVNQEPAQDGQQAPDEGEQSEAEKAQVNIGEDEVQSTSSAVQIRDDETGTGELRNRT